MEQSLHYDEGEDRLTIATVQDCNPIMASIKRQKEVMLPKREGIGYYVGTIPDVIVLRYMKEFGIDFREFMGNSEHIHRIMNDPDYKRFRVWEGKL